MRRPSGIRAAALAGENRKASRLLVAVAISLAAITLASAWYGKLGTLGALPKTLSALWHRTWNGSSVPPELLSDALGDVPSLVLGVVLPLMVPIVFWQWKRMRYVVTRLIDAGVWTFSSDTPVSGSQDESEYSYLVRQVARTNDTYSLFHNYTLLFFISAWIFSLAYVLVLRGFGTYGILTSIPDDLDSYANWWASNFQPAGQAVYQFIGAYAMYFVLLQNAVGIRLLILLWRIRDVGETRLNTISRDGLGGWGSFNEVYNSIIVSAGVSGIALLGLFVTVSPAGARSWTGLLAFFFVFVVLNPVYMIVPLVLIVPRLRKYKRERLEFLELEILGLDGRIQSSGDQKDIATRNLHHSEYVALQALPASPVAMRKLFVSITTNVLPYLAIALGLFK